MRRLTPWAVFVLCMVFAAPASADSSVVMLGMRSIEGDDDVAGALTDALRAAAHTVGDWTVQDRGPTMSQMSMAHSCDEIDARCLTDIAEGLDVDLVVYGSVRRTSTRDTYDYSLTLSLFDARLGSIEQSITEKVLRADVDGGSLSTQAAGLIGKLAGQATDVELGALRIILNVTVSANVKIDGQNAGRANGGSFVKEGVVPGEHELTVEAEGYNVFETSFTITAGEATKLAANLSPADGSAPPGAAMDDGFDFVDSSSDRGGSGLPPWVTYALLGTAGMGLIGTVVSWVVIDSVNEDPLFVEYSGEVHAANRNSAVKVTDVCQHADDGNLVNPRTINADELIEVQNMCATGATFEILQWVFLSTAIIAGGLGTYLLIADPGGSTAAGGQPLLAIQPSLGKDHGGVTATLRF